MNLADLQSMVLTRLGDDGTYYPGVVDAINEGQRLFCLITLCLELQEPFQLAEAQTFYNILEQLPLFVLTRRMFNSDGKQLRPATFAELQALDSNWQVTQGTPERYVMKGLDFLAIYPQPAAADYLIITQVRPPLKLVNPHDVPEIRTASHWALASYAAWAVRQVEGGQEFAKFQNYFQEFMAETQVVAKLVRQRTEDAGLEIMPFELTRLAR